MALQGREFVFGYGSLAALADGVVPARTPRAEGFVCDLPGYRRQWGVAMDNRRDLPGYKHYTDELGRRPAVFVCFLDVTPDPRASVNGLCVPVDDARLAVLDDRERNYERADVSAVVDARGGRVWAYVGARASRLRMRWAVAAHRAVIDAAYLELVAAGFAALGAGELQRCAPSLAPGLLPVVPLTRHDHL
jgi:Gamma-glutamyl cyclotransferase, AIG2-like